MKIIHKAQVDVHKESKKTLEQQYKDALKLHDEIGPKPVAVRKHNDDAPRELVLGIVVMPGDYFFKDDADNYVIVNAKDIGKDGAWEEVE